MASESFDEDSESKRPNVQIGDPYFEKLLIESCLSVIQENLVVSIQDMGAAGLTSSSFEMASKGGLGMELKLDQVPIRDSSITPEEILLSESQERMLLICEPERLESLQKHFEKWGLDAKVIGKLITDMKIKLCWRGEILTEIDPDLLVENSPVYERKFSAWNFPNRKQSQGPAASLASADIKTKVVKIVILINRFVTNENVSF
jgi:phosphoribosylformylglycinamidine synthase